MNWAFIYSFVSRYFWRKIDNIILKGSQYIETPDLTVTDDLDVTGDTSLTGFLKFTATGKKISSGAITAVTNIIPLESESGTSDDLDTINPSDGVGMIICLVCKSGHTITVKDGTGNINLDSGDVTLGSINDNLWLYKRYAGGDWLTFNSQGY